jgi:four helix bundle protein
MHRLSHERLEVYQKAVEFFAVAVKLLDDLPKGHRTIADQMRRASLSTLLNIAEAAGKPSPAEGRHHFAIARGSALECAAALDAIRLLGLAENEPIERGKDHLVAVVSMLSKMCRVQPVVSSCRFRLCTSPEHGHRALPVADFAPPPPQPRGHERSSHR